MTSKYAVTVIFQLEFWRLKIKRQTNLVAWEYIQANSFRHSTRKF